MSGQEITLSTSDATGQFFTSPPTPGTPSTPVTRVVIPAGLTSVTFYYVDTKPATISADGAHLTAASEAVAAVPGTSQIVFGSPLTITAGVTNTGGTVNLENYLVL